MKPRWLPFIALLAATMALSGPAHAQDPRMVAGPIEKIDGQGRIHVSGEALVIDQDTEILDQHYQQVTRGELSKGMRVEVTFEIGPTRVAKRIFATLVR